MYVFEKGKCAVKGTRKDQNEDLITVIKFREVLMADVTDELPVCTDRGFRLHHDKDTRKLDMYTYSKTKNAITALNPKNYYLDCRVHCRTLDATDGDTTDCRKYFYVPADTE